MKVLGLDLDNSPHIAQDKSLRYAKNITIDNKGQSYFNERGFDFIGELDDHDKLAFSHNPFSMPQGGLEALENQNPLEILAYQYDIVCNGIELS